MAEGQTTDTPAVNYVPYYKPNNAAEENLKMDLDVAMLDPEFREHVQDIEEAFKDPETAIALQNLVTAFEIADDIEGAIDQAKQIIERGAPGTDLNAMLGDAVAKARASPETPSPEDALTYTDDVINNATGEMDILFQHPRAQ